MQPANGPRTRERREEPLCAWPWPRVTSRPVNRFGPVVLLLAASAGCESELRCEEDERKVADQCVRCGRYEEKLLGTYVSRNTLFVDSTVASERAVSPVVNYGLTQFVRRDSGIVFVHKLCGGDSMDPNAGSYTPDQDFLAHLGRGEVAVEVDCQGGGFSTAEEDRTIGWSRSLPEGCGQGATESHFAWDATQRCVCPAEDALAELPTRVDDCRLEDADGDKRPGYNVKLSYNVFPLGETHVDVTQVLLMRGHFEGHVDDDGPTAVRWFDSGSQVAAPYCDIPALPGFTMCLDSQVTYCTGPVNELVLLRIPDGDWNCSKLKPMSDSLFASVAAASVPTLQMCAAEPTQARAELQ